MIYKPRDISAIFPDYYIGAPDEQYIRRRCATHMGEATTPEDIYRWIDRETCPYMREAYAGTCLRLLEEWQEDEEHRLRYDIREMAEFEIRKIIRYAQTDQIAEERLAAELGVKDNPATRDASLQDRMNQMELRMGQMSQEIEELKSAITQPNLWRWTSFTPTASYAQRQDFERRLTELCASTSRKMSSDVKRYLEYKEHEGVIVRPRLLSEEYRMILLFGYNRSYQAYHNA